MKTTKKVLKKIHPLSVHTCILTWLTQAFVSLFLVNLPQKSNYMFIVIQPSCEKWFASNLPLPYTTQVFVVVLVLCISSTNFLKMASTTHATFKNTSNQKKIGIEMWSKYQNNEQNLQIWDMQISQIVNSFRENRSQMCSYIKHLFDLLQMHQGKILKSY